MSKMARSCELVAVAVALIFMLTLCKVNAIPLYIIVAFPNTTVETVPYHRCHTTADLAFKEVEQWKSQGKLRGLDGYELEPRYISTYPVPGHPTYLMGAALKSVTEHLLKERVVALLGEAEASIEVAEVTTVFSLPMISPIFATLPLYDSVIYPHVVNVRDNTLAFAEPIVKLMGEFKWKRAAIIKDVLSPLFTAATDLEKRLKASKYTLVRSEVFTPERAKAVVEHIRKSGATIIFAYVRPGPYIAYLMCQAYIHNLYGKNYMWFLQNFQEVNYQDALKVNPSNCTDKEIIQAVNNSLTVWYSAGGTKKTLTGRDPVEIIRGNGPEEYISALSAVYDAVWTIALGFNGTLPIFSKARMESLLKDRLYSQRNLTTAFLSAVSDLDFDGASGRVKYGKPHIRAGSSEVVKIIDGKRVRMATYSYKTKMFSWLPNATGLWDGHGGSPPLDRIKANRAKKNLILVYVYWAVAGLSTLLALVYALAALIDKTERLPGMSCVVALGIVLMNARAVTESLSVRELDKAMLTIWCQIGLWFQMLGFSFFFGAMTIKAFVVYILCARKQQTISGGPLFAAQALLLLLDLAILLPWQLIDPMRVTDLKIPAPSTYNPPTTVSVCTSVYITYWMIGVSCIKGLLLIVGAFIMWPAWIVSHNYGDTDVVYTGICMYIFIAANTVGIPITYLLQPQFASFLYAFVGGTTLVATLPTAIILLSVKGYAVTHRDRSSLSKVMSPLGGTFRFMSLLGHSMKQ